MKIHDALFILEKSHTMINTASFSLTTGIVPEKWKVPWVTMRRDVAIINYIVFREEYDPIQGRIEPQFKDRMKQVKDACRPIMERIEKWDGLMAWRTRFVAHPQRDRDKQGEFVMANYRDFNVPMSSHDIRKLSLYMDYVWGVINCEFFDEVEELKIHPKYQGAQNFGVLGNDQQDEDDFQSMTDAVNEILLNQGKKYKTYTIRFETIPHPKPMFKWISSY